MWATLFVAGLVLLLYSVPTWLFLLVVGAMFAFVSGAFGVIGMLHLRMRGSRKKRLAQGFIQTRPHLDAAGRDLERALGLSRKGHRNSARTILLRTRTTLIDQGESLDQDLSSVHHAITSMLERIDHQLTALAPGRGDGPHTGPIPTEELDPSMLTIPAPSAWEEPDTWEDLEHHFKEAQLIFSQDQLGMAAERFRWLVNHYERLAQKYDVEGEDWLNARIEEIEAYIEDCEFSLRET